MNGPAAKYSSRSFILEDEIEPQIPRKGGVISDTTNG